jgi:nucleoside-diphosphate-sugar epimerase
MPEPQPPPSSFPVADLEHVLAHAGDALRSLGGARIFLTGGTGFFGTWMLDSLALANARLNLGVTVTVLSRDPAAFLARRPHLSDAPFLHLAEGDVRTFDLPQQPFTHVIHLATESSERLNREAPGTMLDVIVEGTRRALFHAKRCGARRLLLASSGAVYGRLPWTVDRVAEDFPGGPDPMSPTSAYAEGKRVSELMCAQATAAGEVEAVVARGFAFVGPGLPLDTHFAVGNFLRDALAGGPIRIGGDGTPLRSYLHAADLAAWMWVLLARGAPGRAYNVGSEDARSIRDIAEAVALAAGIPGSVEVAGTPVPDRPPERYVPDTTRARNELGLRVAIPLDDALARTWNWLRSNPVG